MLMLYYTLIYPHLSYCCIVWGCAADTNLKHLLSLQKRAIRLITKSCYRAPSKPLFVELNLLNLTDICSLQTLNFMFMFKQLLLPKSCYSLLETANPCKRYNTRKTSYFKCMRFRTNIGKACIKTRGPTLWNTLPDNITRNSVTLHGFKREVLAFLISKYKP